METFFLYAFLMICNETKGKRRSNLDLAIYVSLAPDEPSVNELVRFLLERKDHEIEALGSRRPTMARDLVRMSRIFKKRGVRVIKFNGGHQTKLEASKFLYAFAHCLPKNHLIFQLNEDLLPSLANLGFKFDSKQMKALFEITVKHMNHCFTVLLTRDCNDLANRLQALQIEDQGGLLDEEEAKKRKVQCYCSTQCDSSFCFCWDKETRRTECHSECECPCPKSTPQITPERKRQMEENQKRALAIKEGNRLAQNLVKIRDLNSLSAWVIKGRVELKSPITGSTFTRFFEVKLVDDSGSIRMVAFDEKSNNATPLEERFKKVEHGQTYYVTNGRIQATKRRHLGTTSDFEIVFTSNCKIVPVIEPPRPISLPINPISTPDRQQQETPIRQFGQFGLVTPTSLVKTNCNIADNDHHCINCNCNGCQFDLAGVCRTCRCIQTKCGNQPDYEQNGDLPNQRRLTPIQFREIVDRNGYTLHNVPGRGICYFHTINVLDGAEETVERALGTRARCLRYGYRNSNRILQNVVFPDGMEGPAEHASAEEFRDTYIRRSNPHADYEYTRRELVLSLSLMRNRPVYIFTNFDGSRDFQFINEDSDGLPYLIYLEGGKYQAPHYQAIILNEPSTVNPLNQYSVTPQKQASILSYLNRVNPPEPVPDLPLIVQKDSDEHVGYSSDEDSTRGWCRDEGLREHLKTIAMGPAEATCLKKPDRDPKNNQPPVCTHQLCWCKLNYIVCSPTRAPTGRQQTPRCDCGDCVVTSRCGKNCRIHDLLGLVGSQKLHERSTDEIEAKVREYFDKLAELDPELVKKLVNEAQINWRRGLDSRPFVQCRKKDGNFRCSFKTYATGQAKIDFALNGGGHHCEVDDHRLSGAYVYVIVDESGKLLYILYPGFGKNLCKSLRFLSLVNKWAKGWVRERDTLDDLFKECKKSNYRIHLVLFEMDEDHEKSYWGGRFDGKNGISHHAEGVLLEQFRKQRLGQKDGMFKYCLNVMPGWTDKKKFKDFDFPHYLSVIEEKIRLGDSLILEEADFESLAETMEKNTLFISNDSILTRSSFNTQRPNFNDMIKDLKEIEQNHRRKFRKMPKPFR